MNKWMKIALSNPDLSCKFEHCMIFRVRVDGRPRIDRRTYGRVFQRPRGGSHNKIRWLPMWVGWWRHLCDVTAGVRSTAVQIVWTDNDDATKEAQTTRRRKNSGHVNGRIVLVTAPPLLLLLMLSADDDVENHCHWSQVIELLISLMTYRRKDTLRICFPCNI